MRTMINGDSESSISDLLDEGPSYKAHPNSSAELEDTSSVLSDQSFDTSIHVFFGAQARSVPAGWRSSTQHTASVPICIDAVHRLQTLSIDIASPHGSPLFLPRETSRDSTYASDEAHDTVDRSPFASSGELT